MKNHPSQQKQRRNLCNKLSSWPSSSSSTKYANIWVMNDFIPHNRQSPTIPNIINNDFLHCIFAYLSAPYPSSELFIFHSCKKIPSCTMLFHLNCKIKQNSQDKQWNRAKKSINFCAAIQWEKLFKFTVWRFPSSVFFRLVLSCFFLRYHLRHQQFFTWLNGACGWGKPGLTELIANHNLCTRAWESFPNFIFRNFQHANYASSPQQFTISRNSCFSHPELLLLKLKYIYY